MTKYARQIVGDIDRVTKDHTPEDEMLDFYNVAVVSFGLSATDADEVDQLLTTRVMRMRGAI